MTAKKERPARGKYKVTELGGERSCECNCGKTFPRSKSTNGVERRFWDDGCQRRAAYERRKSGIVDPDRSVIAQKATASIIKSLAENVKFRDLPYNRLKQCAQDEHGRPCVCVNYSDCSECWEVGKLTKLELAGGKNSKGVCYQPTRAAANGSAIDCTRYHSEHKRGQSTRGAE